MKVLHETQVGGLTVRVVTGSPYMVLCPMVAAVEGEDRWTWWAGLQIDGEDPTSATADDIPEGFDELLTENVAGPPVERLVAAFGVPWKSLPMVIERQQALVLGMPPAIMAELDDESPEQLRLLRRLTGDDLDAMPLALRAIRLQKTDRWGAIS